MRFLRKIKWSKRKLLTVSMVVLIFVMSLGYAALSQFIELDGIAMIDRSWIVKITNVTSSVTGSGVDKSHTYVSTTATMNATLPTAESTVTYTITLENQGNLVAKLSMIDKIEDDNTGITYTISGVTEGETLLKPGQTNTVTVTMKYADGVTSVGSTEKSLMLTFNYVENESSSIVGDNTVTVGTNNKEYKFGDRVTLIDGSAWYVVKTTNAKEELVTMVMESFDDVGYKAFDTSGSVNYNPNSSTNIGYYIDNSYIPTLASAIESSGGDATGLTGRLLTKDELDALEALYYSVANENNSTNTKFYENFYGGPYWTMTAASDTHVYTGNSGYDKMTPTSEPLIKPVITTLKSNITSIDLGNRIAFVDNKPQSDSSINFGAPSSDTNGKGMYYTKTNTEDNKATYYFRGNVENNYVSFGTYQETHSYYDTEKGETITFVEGTPILWRIVRVNEDGSIRLISQNNIGENYYNDQYNDNAGVGYMYGTPGSSSYDATHKNTYDSEIKMELDEWYDIHLSSYSSFFSTNAGFCNDRGLTGGSGASNNESLYAANDRMFANAPVFKCYAPEKDLFTITSSAKGNKKLRNPIGMLTVDEAVYAGGAVDVWDDLDYYLDNNDWWWTMSPSEFTLGVDMWAVYTGAIISTVTAEDPYGTRPVINLKADVNMIIGDGTINNPYKIENIEDKKLSEVVLEVNQIQDDSQIDFSQSSTWDNENGIGLFESSEKSNGNSTYYFRGNYIIIMYRLLIIYGE